MYRNQNLGTITWSGDAGAMDSIELRNLLHKIDGDAYGVESLTLAVTLDLTTTTGTGCTGREIMEWFSNILLQANIGIPFEGINSYDLMLLQAGTMGLYVGTPADIAASQTNAIRIMYIILPFTKFRSPKPDKPLPCAQALKDATITITGGPEALNAETTVNSVTIRAAGRIRRQGKVRFPSIPRWRSAPKKLHCSLPAGQYEGMLIVAPVGGFVAVANFASVVLRAGSENIHNSLATNLLIAAYLQDQVAGFPGMQPFLASNNALDWTNDFDKWLGLPIVWQNLISGQNKLTDQVDSGTKALSLQIEGSLDDMRLAYCYYPKNTTENQRNQAETFGADMASLDLFTPNLQGIPIPSASLTDKPGIGVLPVEVRSIVGPGAGDLKYLVRK